MGLPDPRPGGRLVLRVYDEMDEREKQMSPYHKADERRKFLAVQIGEVRDEVAAAERALIAAKNRLKLAELRLAEHDKANPGFSFVRKEAT